MNRKGFIDVQFNWIYVAIVGAIVLMIFVSVAMNIRKGANEKLAVDAMDYFEEIFTSLHKSENTETTITLPGIDLQVDASQMTCDYYTIGDSGLQGRSIKYIPFFSPDIVKDKIVSYALSWNVPYRVNYFLYITSPDVAYVFVGGAAEDLMDSLPSNVLVEEKGTSSEFVNRKHYKVKYIFEDQDPGSIDQSVIKMKNTDVKAIKFAGNKVEFYEKDGNNLVKVGESYFMDDETKLAALYSEDQGHYECNVLKGVRRISKLSTVLMARVDKIIASSEVDAECDSYAEAKTMLNEMLTRAELMDQDNKLSEAGMNKLKDLKVQLKDLNTELNTQACPTIY